MSAPGAASALRTVYHGTTPLLDDAIREGGMPGPIIYVARRRPLAEFFAWQAAAFALINGLSTSCEGLVVTLTIEASRLRLDRQHKFLGPMVAGESIFFKGPAEPESIVGRERVLVQGRDLMLGIAAARRWKGWPGALPEGQQPVGPHPDEPSLRELCRRHRPRGRRRGDRRESWRERCARVEREDSERAAALEAQKQREEAWAREQERAWGIAPRTIPDPQRLLTVAHAAPSSSLHGAAHALEVAIAGVRLIEAGALGDPAVVLAFAILHDSQRRSEGHDPEHGARAAALARGLTAEVHALSEEQLEVLCRALVDHDRGHTSTDPTIGTCWDADRLTLPRVGIAPRPEYLSTTAGRELAADLPEPPADATWEWVSERLSDLAQPAYARAER